ncbi:hypothetical protein [Dactylosporangium sp. CA-233914]|uniref:hypothetical protein n=1 Tax=Dactylosporangium sp. CA-233914 TaxID=3239934 RepID=UPI003D8E841A
MDNEKITAEVGDEDDGFTRRDGAQRPGGDRDGEFAAGADQVAAGDAEVTLMV